MLSWWSTYACVGWTLAITASIVTFYLVFLAIRSNTPPDFPKRSRSCSSMICACSIRGRHAETFTAFSSINSWNMSRARRLALSPIQWMFYKVRGHSMDKSKGSSYKHLLLACCLRSIFWQLPAKLWELPIEYLVWLDYQNMEQAAPHPTSLGHLEPT